MKSKNAKYPGFFDEAKKTMSEDSIKRAGEKANQIILNARLAELRKDVGYTQAEIHGYRQSSVSKIEGRKDLKVSTLIAYCKSLGMGIEIKTYPANAKGKFRKKPFYAPPETRESAPVLFERIVLNAKRNGWSTIGHRAAFGCGLWFPHQRKLRAADTCLGTSSLYPYRNMVSIDGRWFMTGMLVVRLRWLFLVPLRRVGCSTSRMAAFIL